MDDHKMQIAPLPRPVDQESHKQNLAAQVQQFVENSGLKELELTFKATFNGKNKDKITTRLESDHTLKENVMDDDHGHCPKSQGHCCGRHGGGAHVCHGGVPNCGPCGQVHISPYNSYGGNYGPSAVESNYWSTVPRDGLPIDPETPWQRDCFPPPAPVAGYEPSAPPWYGNHDESPSSCITNPMVDLFLLLGGQATSGVEMTIDIMYVAID
ncbi:hypothetical protein RHMOL_Rhmol12G0010100 [Rhododendron molle]|uniref:Uncharacterized protein n=1 Tax=Rhododendron molle TaxID=49168 RepID=A0ACC0LDH3_RHOML|nr:hypothetical protein RHMOL_Rhmol12G0010100 [Rhododendron molle]